MLPLGKSGNRRDDRYTNAFRRSLEAAILQAHGTLSVPSDTHAWAASKLFARCRKLERRLKEHGSEMTHGEFLSYHDRLARFEELLSRHVRSLNLDAGGQRDAFAQLYTIRVSDEADDAASEAVEPLQDK